MNAASLVPGSAICEAYSDHAYAQVHSDFIPVKIHFVIFRPATNSVSTIKWGGWNQIVTFSSYGVSISPGDKLLIWDDNYTMYEDITCS
ncbi:hypothetical protein CSB07_01275 [Candidatus Gracilibacteria bacterium]|nr:MAG: hypothetical protein CSB07_01275 [Candidatus Gracilibacteria bacterium]